MADGPPLPAGQTFSTTVGLLYVFNLIVGTGALALPRAFQTAGYVLGVVLLLISAFTSYVCATFVLESMAIANCVLRRAPPRRHLAPDGAIIEEDVPSSADGEMSEVRVGSVVVGSGGEQGHHRFSFSGPPPAATTTTATSPSLNEFRNEEQRRRMIEDSDFDVTRRVEISEMAHLFLGQSGTIMAYLQLTIYLFCDLAVYSTTVPKSLANVICSSLNESSSASLVNSSSSPCHRNSDDLFHSISRFAVYRLCIFAFLIFCFPMVLMGMTRTKWLQLATTLSRWTAFLLMIILASVQLTQRGSKGSPSAADFHGFGPLFGVAVYAFMCHHSIPGLITPIRNKSYLSAKLTSVYAVVFLFYCVLSLTGSFAFEHVHDIYTINFLHDDQTGGFLNALMDYFLALFPVFVLTSSYVIVAITLCNNIRVLINLIGGTNNCRRSGTDRERLIGGTNAQGREESEALLGDVAASPSSVELVASSSSSNFHLLFHQFGLPLLVVSLPALISFLTDNVLLLASITGSFPGVGVQFVLPTLLCLGARRTLSSPRLGFHPSVPSHLRSPFSHWFWPIAILAWACFAVVVVAANLFRLH